MGVLPPFSAPSDMNLPKKLSDGLSLRFGRDGIVFFWEERREWRSLHSLRSVEMTERNPVEMTEKGSLVIPCPTPSVIPGLTGNLSR